MTREPVIEAVRAYVMEAFLYGQPDFPLGPEDSLLEQRVLDSLGVMELVEWLGSRFEIEIADEEITEENLGTLSSIAALVLAKRAERAAA